jgi:hypothetical protein
MWTRFLVVAVVLLIPVKSLADTSLSNWFRTEAAPGLARMIDEQPRFIGEPVEILAMAEGIPRPVGDALTGKLRRDMLQYLLAESNARVPIRKQAVCEPPRANVVLGIDVQRHLAGKHRVVLALLDLGDNIWINGSSQVWIGRLTAEDRRLLATPRGSACADNPAEPITHTAADRIAVDAADGGAIRPVAQPVRWAGEYPPAPLLTEIVLSNKKRYCRGKGRNCVDVTYELLDDAYVFEFYTKAGKLVPLSCEDLSEARSGNKAFGLKVPETRDRGRPALGYYVLATRQAATASILSQLVRAQGERCDVAGKSTDLADLATFVTERRIDWQALHLGNHGGRVFSFKGDDS